ncbi:hypothetical protein N0V90_000337 [Kalmusia sp. IMI 367209]|nr:hypothetical protein N0V90_000337 [Kalmusia sp. IMI 367209]
MTPVLEPFRHEPLDHDKPSIRLLSFSERCDEQDVIQCVMRHATIRDRYICLSYCWGDDVPTNRILINGKEIYVRKNLFDFLKVAEKKELEEKARPVGERRGRGVLRERWYWIDALCIDQDNVAERNHQVQQMGKIYARADRVLLWLGRAAEVGSLSNYFQPADTFFETLDQSRRMGDHVYDNEYWRRAWVTQEIVLARFVVILVNDEEVYMEKLIENIPPPENAGPIPLPFAQFAKDLGSLREMGPGTVFNLFKTCPVWRSFSVFWRQPSTPDGKQIVWLEPYIDCDLRDVRQLCEYGEGFEVLKKDGTGYSQTRVQDRASRDPDAYQPVLADDVDTVRWHSGRRVAYNSRPRDKLSDEHIEEMDVYTVRMSFAVLAKIMVDEPKLCDTHCVFERRKLQEWNAGLFEYARIGCEGQPVLSASS